MEEHTEKIDTDAPGPSTPAQPAASAVAAAADTVAADSGDADDDVIAAGDAVSAVSIAAVVDDDTNAVACAEDTVGKTEENIEIIEVSDSAASNATSADAESENPHMKYLLRDEFTSEIFKIEVRNLGFFAVGEFRKLLRQKLQLNVSKIKCPGSRDFAYVCFRSKEDQMHALKLLNGYKWKNRILEAATAKASADPLQKRRSEEQMESGVSETKKKRTSAEATCPLASMPYEEQLVQKNDEMQKILDRYNHELLRLNCVAAHYVRRFEYGGLLPSPQIDGYRNKNEFTVGTNASGEAVVGFRLGAYADGSTEVAEIDNLPHIPLAAKWAANSYQTFVRQSRFVPFNPESNSGHFRQLMVRTSSHTGEVMLVAGIYSTNLSDTELVELKESLITYYNGLQGKYRCSSLYYQDVKHREAGQKVNPIEHLSGKKHISDTIHSLDFVISPLAFFQINTAAANVLYQKIIDLAAPTENTTVLDICCGTGTIALAFAKYCRKVMGVEIIPEAIKDANYNAAKNQIKNCKFFAGNADDFIMSMVREAVYDNPPNTPLDIVAIVDPPRAGLHNRSIMALRAATQIKRIVYVSCNPQRAYKNWLDLGRPESKQYKGDPFLPKGAVSVDMFPHTTHTELIILLERATLLRSVASSRENRGNTGAGCSKDAGYSDGVASCSKSAKRESHKPIGESIARTKQKRDHRNDDKYKQRVDPHGGTGAGLGAAAVASSKEQKSSTQQSSTQEDAKPARPPDTIETIVIEDSEEARRRFEESLVDEEPDEIPLACD